MTALKSRAGQLLVDQIRMGGARGWPAMTANRKAEPSRIGGSGIAEKEGA